MASAIPTNTLNVLKGRSFFPNAIASPFMSALTTAFIIGAILCFAAAVCSALRGGKYVYSEQNGSNNGLENSAAKCLSE